VSENGIDKKKVRQVYGEDYQTDAIIDVEYRTC